MAQEQPAWSPNQLAARRAAKRRSHFESGLNLWPFVGVMFTLLVVFMIGPYKPFHYSRWGWGVRLPRTPHAVLQPSASREDAMRIVITRDGRALFNDDTIKLNDIPRKIEESVNRGSEPKVYLAVDAAASYGDVKAVLGEIQRTGITQTCFIATQGEFKVFP